MPWDTIGFIEPTGSDQPLAKALVDALSFVLIDGGQLEGVTILLRHDGRFTVTCRNPETGVSTTTSYKLRKSGPPLIWHADPRLTV